MSTGREETRANGSAILFPDNLASLAACRELGLCGVDVHVVGHAKGPAGFSRFATWHEAPNFYEASDDWLTFVCKLADVLPDTPVLFATEDAALLVAERHHDALAERCLLPYPEGGVINNILDKLNLYTYAQTLKIGVPEFRELSRAEDARALNPAKHWLVKPSCRYLIDDQGRVQTFLAVTGGAKALAGDAVDSARTVLESGFPAVAQETVPGPFEDLVSVGLLIDRQGKCRASFTTRKHCEYPEPFGDGLIVQSVPDPGITDKATALLADMGYFGMCDVEFKLDERDNTYRLLDANPRPWLWQGLAPYTGCFPLAYGAYLLARETFPADTSEPVFPRKKQFQTDSQPTWVGARGAAAFAAGGLSRWRNDLSMPLRLTTGALQTMLRDLSTFRDPIYFRPSAWKVFIEAAGRRLKRLAKPS